MKQGWERKKLGDCFESIRNGVTIKQERGAIGVPITRIETLSGGVFNRDRLGYANIQSTEKYASYVLDDGDLLLSHINSKTYIGRTVVYNRLGDEEIIHGMNLLRLKAIRTILSPYYAFYCFKSDVFKDQIASYRKDAVNQSSIPVSDLKKVLIPVPPLSIQERIVEELDCISGIIEKKKEQLKELDALAQSIFYTMFGDPVENDKGWETCPVIEVVKMQRGFDLPVQHRDGKGDIPIYGSNGVIGYHSEYKAKTGIITGRSGTLGEVYVSNEPYWPLNTTLFSVDTHGNNIIYLKYLMKYFHLERFKAGAGVPTLNRNEFHNKPIPLIPLPLQQEFAKKIEAIEKQKELIKRSIGEVETLLASRMQEYFE